MKIQNVGISDRYRNVIEDVRIDCGVLLGSGYNLCLGDGSVVEDVMKLGVDDVVYIDGGVCCVRLGYDYTVNGIGVGDFMSAVGRVNSLLEGMLCIVSIPNGGRGLLFRCSGDYEVVDKVLAKGDSGEVLCEVVSGVVAVSGGGYNVVQGELSNIPYLSEREYSLLCLGGYSLDRGCLVMPSYGGLSVGEVYTVLYGDQLWGEYALFPDKDYNTRGGVVTHLSGVGWFGAEGVEVEHEGKVCVRVVNMTFSLGVVLEGWYCDFDRTLWYDDRWMSGFDALCYFNHYGDRFAGMKELIGVGYGQRVGTIVKQFSIDMLLRKSAPQGTKISDDNSSIYAWQLLFWEVGAYMKPVIHESKFLLWLGKQGFHLFLDPLSGEYSYVQVKNNIVFSTSSKGIKDYVINFIGAMPSVIDGVRREYLLNTVMRHSRRFFSRDTLDFLKPLGKEFIKDRDGLSYIPFKNGVLTVMKGDISLTPYKRFHLYVHKESIIDHNIYVNISMAWQSSFYRFITLIGAKEETNIKAFMSTIGYLLHLYKNPSQPYMVNFTDALSEYNNKPQGGTGKGIIVQAVAKIRDVMSIDAKKRDFIDKPFAYQRLTSKTQLIAIHDLPRNFNIEKLFNTITEGITLEKKYHAEQYVEYADSPKIIINTNYSLQGEGSSFARRTVPLVLHPHFNDAHTPFHEFGENLFNEWGYVKNNNFYNLMILCLQMFLAKGIVRQLEGEAKINRLISDTSVEFVQFFGALLKKSNINKNGVAIPKEYTYNMFIDKYHASITPTQFNNFVNKIVLSNNLHVSTKSISYEGMKKVNCWVISSMAQEVYSKVNAVDSEIIETLETKNT